jgi:hypothetical protein
MHLIPPMTNSGWWQHEWYLRAGRHDPMGFAEFLALGGMAAQQPGRREKSPLSGYRFSG